ncbi:MAG: hypothetical protein AAB675_03970 [Patescibacteria group bacterium]
MDKKTQNLDPQLKAAYERVMGTNIPPATPAPTVTPGAQAPQATQVQAPQAQAPVVSAGSDATKVVAGGGSGSRKLSPILIIVAILLFFAVYTFIWLTVFKVKIPFLPF